MGGGRKGVRAPRRGPGVPIYPEQLPPRCSSLAQVPAAAPTAALGAEGGELQWRVARPAPASSSARPGARTALVRCGGGRRARRPGLWVRAAVAAYCLPGATSKPQAEQPRWRPPPPSPQHPAQQLRPGELRARPPQASALCDAAPGDCQAICELGTVCLPDP